ncbi:unnamed protein product [Scytosiphon promiscuus]
MRAQGGRTYTMVLDGGNETVVVLDEAGTLQQRRSANAVRVRLTLCIFLYTVGASMMSQIYPKIILISFEGDDGDASKYRGWTAAAVSVVQLIFIPALSGSSDVLGRKAVFRFALGLHAVSVFALATVASSLVWATVCRLVTSACLVISPVSQAIMIDLSPEGGKAATHGLGIAFGVFALGNSAGDIVGGFFGEHHRGAACLVSGGLATSSLLLVTIFGWKETAPSHAQGGRRRRRRRPSCCCWLPSRRTKKARGEEGIAVEREHADGMVIGHDTERRASRGHSAVIESAAGTGSAAGGSRGGGVFATANDDGGIEQDGQSVARRGSAARTDVDGSNPLSALKVFLESRVLLRIAFCYFAFVLSLNVFATGYNYVDYRFHWTPPEISYFFATYNILMALAGGWVIRGIVPSRLSEENGALFGIFVQACAVTVSGLCFRGWMLYPALTFGALQNITEPCLQAVMATFVGADKQGSLQGAVMSLRVVGEGVAAPVFTQVFSAGASVGFEQAPFFLAAVISLIGLAVAWMPLRKLDKKRRQALGDQSVGAPPATAPAAGDRLQCEAEKGSAGTADTAADSRRPSAPASAGDDEGRTCVDDSDPDQHASARNDEAPLLADQRGDAAVTPTGGSSDRRGVEEGEWKEGVKLEEVREDELRRPLLQDSPGPAWD